MKIKFGPEYRVFTDFISEVSVEGATVGDCLERVFALYPQLYINLLKDDYKGAKATGIKLNGEYIWETAAIHIAVGPDDKLELTRDVPEGSKGGFAQMLMGVAALALFLVPGGQVAGIALTTAQGGLTVAGTMVMGLGMSLTLSGLSQVIAGKPNLPTYDNSDNSSTYSFGGIRNTTAPGTSLNVVYGRHRVGGHTLNAFSTVVGNATFLSALFGLSEGPINKIYLDDIRVNNRLIVDYPETDFNIEWREGTKEQEGKTSLYTNKPDTVFVPFVNIRRTEGNSYTFTTPECSQIKLEYTINSKYNRYSTIKAVIVNTATGKAVSIKKYNLKTAKQYKECYINFATPGMYSITVTPFTLPQSKLDLDITFKGYEYLYAGSTTIQSAPTIPWFNNIESTTTLNTEIPYDSSLDLIKDTTPNSTKQTIINGLDGITYNTSSLAMSSLRVSISAPAIYKSGAKGIKDVEVVAYIYYKKEDDVNYGLVPVEVTVKGKTKSEHVVSAEVPIDSLGVYVIKVCRKTPISESMQVVDNIYLKDVTEVLNDQFIYPHTALLGMRIKASEQLSGSMPTITSLIEGIKVYVPEGYDGYNRKMTGSWNGNMKEEREYTNNPVWCLYDLLTNTRYGLGDYFQIDESKRPALLNNFAAMAAYCDQRLRDDGTVVLDTDPDHTQYIDTEYCRFSLDIVLDSARTAIEWLNIICATMQATLYYAEGTLVLDIARPKVMTQIFNMSNIEKGSFKIVGGSYKSIPNAYEVQFANEDKNYELDLFRIESKDLQLDSVIEERKQSLNLIGVTSLKRAKRLAKYALGVGEENLSTVSFSTGTEGLLSTVGDVVGVQHDVPQWGFGGRVVDYDSETGELTLSSNIEFKINSLGAPYKYSIKLSHKGSSPETYGIEEQEAGTITNVVTLTNSDGDGGLYDDLTFTPTKDDIYVIGETSFEVRPFEIKSVRRSPDEKVELVCVDYNESIFAASDNIIEIAEHTEHDYSFLPDPTAAYSVYNFRVEARQYTTSFGEYQTGVDVYYTKPNETTWSGCTVYYSEAGGSNYKPLPIDNSGYVFVPSLLDGDYTFVATSSYYDGRHQTISEALSDSTFKPYATLTVSSLGLSKQFNKGVNGITLDGNPNGTTFDGKDLKVNWKLGSTLDINVDLPADEEEYGVDTALSQSWFSHYVVKVLDSDNTVRRTAPELKANTFTYTHAENYADGSGVPLRSFEVQVEAVDKLAQVSTPTRIQVSNPVPAVLTGLTVTPVFQGFHVTFDPSKEPDVQGYVIHASRTSGFTPSDANLINNGSETSKTYRVSTKGVWYVKAAAYDYYDRADAVDYSQLNYTAEQVVVVAEQQIVPSDLYMDLRVDFMVHEIIFRMVTTTLTWSNGTITRGGTEYTLAAGTLASAVGCYVIGTLSGGAVTLSLAPVANGIPTLSTGQVILAQTASVPSIDGNYIVYVRQANSVMLEGANIREASIYHAQIVSVDADTITVGTLDAAVVDVVNLNADNIVGGSIDASVIDVTNLNADNITAGGIRGINVNASSHTTNGSYLTQSCLAGATELSLHSVEDFVGKSSGWIIDSTNDNDTFSYSGVDLVNKKLTGVLGVLAHSVGATVIPAVRTAVIDERTNDIRLYSASRRVVAISDSITYYEDEATTIAGSVIINTAAAGVGADTYGLIVSSTGGNSGSILAEAAFTAAKFVGRTGLSIVTKNGPPGYSSSGAGVSIELVDSPSMGHFNLTPTTTLPTNADEGQVVMYRKSGWSYAKLCYSDGSSWRLVATDAIVT